MWRLTGFTWEKVQLGKEEEVVREEITQIFTDLKVERGKSIYICQNPAFDRNFFAQLINVYAQEQHHWPYHWLDFASMYWALQTKHYRDKEQHFPEEMNLSKNTIAQEYEFLRRHARMGLSME